MKIIKVFGAAFLMLSLLLLSVSARTKDYTLSQAESALYETFEAIHDAGANGANTTELLQDFDCLSENLSRAMNLAKAGDTETAEELAANCTSSAQLLEEDAKSLKEKILLENQGKNSSRLLSLGISFSVVVMLSVFIWFSAKRLVFRGKLIRRFTLMSSALALIAVIGLSYYVARPLNIQLFKSQGYSELWILGPNNEAYDYPKDVLEGIQQNFNLAVKNNLGSLTYYFIFMKIRDSTQPPPMQNISAPSPLDPIYEFRFAVADGQLWEKNIALEFLNFTTYADYLRFESVKISDILFKADGLTSWKHGFYFQVFFELWVYSPNANDITFTNQYVGLWLNMTKS